MIKELNHSLGMKLLASVTDGSDSPMTISLTLNSRVLQGPVCKRGGFVSIILAVMIDKL